MTDFIGLVILGCVLNWNYNLNLKPLAKVRNEKNQDKLFDLFPGIKLIIIYLLVYIMNEF
jgi:hypothetical protein